MPGKPNSHGAPPPPALVITVCHFPLGTSEWNTIVYRLFSRIFTNWRGRFVSSNEVIVKTIAATSTGTGLRMAAEDWNHALRPQSWSPTAELPDVPALVHLDRTWLLQLAVTGMPTATWRELIEKPTVTRHAQREAALRNRRGGNRERATSAGREAVLSLDDRALSSVLHQRSGTAQRTIAALFGVTRQTIHKASASPQPTVMSS